MLVSKAKYLLSSPNLAGCPVLDRLEFAFIGRSNVGKSSLINYLTNNSSLAKVSKTPGKTKLLNYFEIQLKKDHTDQDILKTLNFVDLPGYGFAKIPQKQRDFWLTSSLEYFEKRENLACVFCLIDSSVSPQKKDLEMLELLVKRSVPIAIIFTKTDKAKKNQINRNIESFEDKLLLFLTNLPPIFQVSSEKKIGREKVLEYVFNM